MLDKNETLLIESYREQSLSWRQDDTMLHRMTAIILPVSIAALIVSSVYEDLPLLLPFFGGVVLMTFWFMLCQVLYIRIRIRFEVMSTIEDHWDIPGHRDFRDIRNDIFGKILTGMRLYRNVFYVYLLMAIAVGLHKWDKTLDDLPYLVSGFLLFIILVILFSWIGSIANRRFKRCKSPTLQKISKDLANKKSDS